MKTFQFCIKILKKTLLILVFSLGFYVICALTLCRITVNESSQKKISEVSIYILSNGVHTDIVVPIQNIYKDWGQHIKREQTKNGSPDARYLALGWGDKGFYLNTPQWSDLKCSTAFNAAFALGSSAMHATFLNTIQENEHCVQIALSVSEYRNLCSYIEKSFQKDTDGNFVFIPANTYGNQDSFYEANGKYNLFHTCNTWTNNALKAAHQKAALWTVTDTGILCHYR